MTKNIMRIQEGIYTYEMIICERERDREYMHKKERGKTDFGKIS